MASKFEEDVVYPDGTPIANAQIFVRLRGSYELASLYSDEDESSSAENPVTTTPEGRLVFFTAPGYYDLFYNGVEFPIIVGSTGGPGNGGQGSYTHVQSVAVRTWTIQHYLGFHPGGVRVIDSVGDELVGAVDYPDINTVTISFGAPTAGVAHLS